MRSIPTIYPAITENTKCLIVEARVPLFIFKVGVSIDHGVPLCFVALLALRTLWATFQTKNNKGSAPASSALTLVSHQSHKVHTANRHLCCGSGGRNGE